MVLLPRSPIGEGGYVSGHVDPSVSRITETVMDGFLFLVLLGMVQGTTDYLFEVI